VTRQPEQERRRFFVFRLRKEATIAKARKRFAKALDLIPVRTKLMFGVGLVVTLLLIVAVTAYVSLTRVTALQEQLYQENFNNVLDAMTLRVNSDAERLDIVVMLDASQTQRGPWQDDLIKRSAQDQTILQHLQKRAADPQDVKILAELASVHDEFAQTRTNDVLPLLYAGNTSEARKLFMGIQLTRHARLRELIEEIKNREVEEAENLVNESARTTRTYVLVAAILGLSSLAVALALAVLMDRILASYIAQRERAQDMLLASNQELEAFSYSVSHDLRTPLRAIDGFSRILLEEYRDRLDDEGQRLLNVVRDSTENMARLIDDILAFSRAGREDVNLSEIDMADLARRVFDELKPPAGRKIEFDMHTLPVAFADTAMMRQVLTNLLSNAIKFTRPRGTAKIEIGGRAERAESIYYVKDNGVGFDPRYVSKLFGVFQRLHTTDEFEGTGIGLAIVRRIVAKHGGRVWAEGKIDEGATFYFSLPRTGSLLAKGGKT
jgi:signal transduction histidine kinase